MAYIEISRYEEALEICKEAIEINPSNVKAYENLGDIYGSLNRYEEEEKYEECVKIREAIAYLKTKK